MFRPFKWISATAVLMCFSFAQAEYLLMTEALKYNIKKEFHACNPQLKMDILTYIEVDSITSIVFQAFKDKPEFWNLRFGHQWLDSRKIVPYLKDHPEILAEMDKVVAHRFNPNGCNWNIDSFANPLTQKQLDDTRKLASNLVKLYQKKLDFKYSEEELKKILPEVYTFLTFTQPVIYMKASELLRYVVADHYFGSMKTNPSDTMFAQTLTRIMGDKYTDEQFVKNYQSIINATKSWVESLEDVLGFILLIFTAPLC